MRGGDSRLFATYGEEWHGHRGGFAEPGAVRENDPLCGFGFRAGEVDATESTPHSIAFNRAPDAVKLTSAGSTQGFNGVDSGVSQASAHTLSDAGNIVEIEDVETFRQCIVVDCDKAVGLIAFACEFGDKPVGGEADGGAHIGADMGGEGFLNGEGFGFGNFRPAIVGEVFRTFRRSREPLRRRCARE